MLLSLCFQIDVLSEVVNEVRGRVEVYVDGGVRQGTDVLKALALGATAVFVGRPVLWGLACKVWWSSCSLAGAHKYTSVFTYALLPLVVFHSLESVILSFTSGRRGSSRSSEPAEGGIETGHGFVGLCQSV